MIKAKRVCKFCQKEVKEKDPWAMWDKGWCHVRCLKKNEKT
jgi:hypothetical protein